MIAGAALSMRSVRSPSSPRRRIFTSTSLAWHGSHTILFKQAARRWNYPPSARNKIEEDPIILWDPLLFIVIARAFFARSNLQRIRGLLRRQRAAPRND